MENFIGKLKAASGKKCLVMGILNITPDSFSDGGRFFDTESALEQALLMVENGADIIDIGGESSRPGSKRVAPEEQLRRILPVIERLREKSDVQISIDSASAEVAKEAIAFGANIINDITALRGDERMAGFAAEKDLPVIIMHMLGDPETMQVNPEYENVVGEVCSFLQQRAEAAISAGVKKHNIIIDPGFGFGKKLQHNIKLMQGLPEIKALGFPVLAGSSRKRMVGDILGVPVEGRMAGSIALNILSVLAGVDIVRVHDVRETCEALNVVEAVTEEERNV